jgi:hypothetical protein
MLGLKTIQSLIGLITLFLAYILTITPAGCFRAWVAQKMGDNTAQDLGFLTLNPWVHIDLFGLIWLLGFSRPEYFSGFGWGKHIPINPHNIYGSRHVPRWAKVGCAFFSDSFAHVMLAILAVVGFTLLFGAKTLALAATHTSSYPLVAFQILVAFVGLNVSLALVQLVINSMVLVVTHLAAGSENGRFNTYTYYFILFTPLFILLLFGDYLQRLLFYAIAAIEASIARMM